MFQQRAIMPMMPAQAYKSYSMLRPLKTHYRKATCQEVGCEQYANGWKTVLDHTDEKLRQRQADYIRTQSRRHFAETRDERGFVVFTFSPEQPCFREHRAAIQRPAVFLVSDGDWRGNPRGTPARQLRDEDWIDDFANHQDKLADAVRQG